MTWWPDKPMTTIYVVGRTVGEYSDRSEDVICWFPVEADACAYAVKCEKASRGAAALYAAAGIETFGFGYEECIQRYGQGLIDRTFHPGSYGADEVSYWVQSAAKG